MNGDATAGRVKGEALHHQGLVGAQYVNPITQPVPAVAKIDKENNLLMINGAVPGPNGCCMIIRETNKVS